MYHCQITKEFCASYKDYLLSEHWNQVKQHYFSRHKAVCRRCGSTKNIQLHHITYENIGQEKDADLKPLCDTCHYNTHNPDSTNLKVYKKKQEELWQKQEEKRIKHLKQEKYKNRKRT